jgi:uncharacterized protein with PIN domain
MPALSEIKIIKIEEELRKCPDCGYELGFHTSFVNAHANKEDPVKSTRELYRVILICPECGARYDVGWKIPASEWGHRIIKTPAIKLSRI